MTKETPKNGLHKTYFDNGQKETEHNYKDSLLSGKWSQWYKNGQVSIIGNYENNHLNGGWKQWDGNGRLVVVGRYKNNMPIDSWVHYVYEDKNLKTEKKDGSLRYWKFVVNAAVRYGEIVDKKK